MRDGGVGGGSTFDLVGPSGRPLTDVLAQRVRDVAKASADPSIIGQAQDAQIATALTGATRSWQQTALQDAAIHYKLYKANPWVRACVDLIAQYATLDNLAIRSASENETACEALRVFLDGINPGQSFRRLLRGIYRDLQITGNWYGRVQSSGQTIAALYRVDFRTIVPRPEPVGPIRVYDLYRNGGSDIRPVEIPAEEIVHITLNDAGENGLGLSNLESLDTTLALDLAATQYNTSFFQNGAKAGDVYALDETMSADQVERERTYLIDNFTKPAMAHTPLFLSGKVKLLRDGAARRDMDFGKLKAWDREEVTAVYSVPLSLITAQMGSLGGNGKEQDLLLLREGVIAPLQGQVAQDLTRQIIRERLHNQDVSLQPPQSTALRLDLLQSLEIASHIGFTGNEIRKAAHLDEQDGLDEPLYLNNRTVALVGKPGEPDSIIYTQKGAVSGRIMDPLEASQQPPKDDSTQETDTGTGTDAKAAPADVKKSDSELPAWLTAHIAEAEREIAAWQRKRTAKIARRGR